MLARTRTETWLSRDRRDGGDIVRVRGEVMRVGSAGWVDEHGGR